MRQLVIIGASGHGKVVADIAKKSGYDKIIFLDDKSSLTKCGDYPVAGASNLADTYDCDVIVAIGNANIRKQIQEKLEKKGHHIPMLIHPDAVIGENVLLGSGTVVMAGAVINPCSRIGKGCIINTCSSIDHDCKIEDYVHVSVGAHLAGNVNVGEKTWIGIGSVVSNNIDICSDCMIGAGAVVVKNIDESGTYIGVPARKRYADSDFSEQ